MLRFGWHHHVHQPISFLQLIPRTLWSSIIFLLFLPLLILLFGQLWEWADLASTDMAFVVACLLHLLSNLGSACMTLLFTSSHFYLSILPFDLVIIFLYPVE